MKKTRLKICTFTFANATEIRAAVPAFSEAGNLFTYEEMFVNAKLISWNGDENHGRGGLIKFEIGDYIYT